MTPQQRALYVLRGREYAENYTVERGSPPKLNKAEGVKIGEAPKLNEPGTNLRSSKSISLADAVRIRSGVGHSRSIKGEALAELETDWSQIFLTFRRDDTGIAKVATAFSDIEGELREVLNLHGYEEAEIKVRTRKIEAEAPRARTERVKSLLRAGRACESEANALRLSAPEESANAIKACRQNHPQAASDVPEVVQGELLLGVTLKGTVDFSDVIADPDLPEASKVSSTYYWFDDQLEALMPLQEAALAKVTAQADASSGTGDYLIERVRYSSNLDELKSYKFTVTPVRVLVTADAFVRFPAQLR
ncbi:MAG: hypothetical protein AAGC79_18100 [Pseudomonadota bacterium]